MAPLTREQRSEAGRRAAETRRRHEDARQEQYSAALLLQFEYAIVAECEPDPERAAVAQWACDHLRATLKGGGVTDHRLSLSTTNASRIERGLEPFDGYAPPVLRPPVPPTAEEPSAS